MRRSIIVGAAVFMTLLMGSTAAMAASPHFINASAARSGDNLVVSWKEAGLGVSAIDYTASATATRVDSCVNNGQNIPADPKKTTSVADVAATGTFNPKNGQVTASLTLSPPTSTLSCPKGQTATLISLSYTNVRITDDTNGIFKDIPGTF